MVNSRNANWVDFETWADITLVSLWFYFAIGSTKPPKNCEVGIDCEIIDLQSLLPFDINQDLVKVLLKQIVCW
jgi:pyruvate/2-oxoglutarate/acetoin dehydrogenase E1 component